MGLAIIPYILAPLVKLAKLQTVRRPSTQSRFARYVVVVVGVGRRRAPAAAADIWFRTKKIF